jgi:hypothetical protein
LLSIVEPKMDEVFCAEEAWEIARLQLHEMASSGKFEMWGILAEDHQGLGALAPGMPKDGARYRQIDSHLFWGRRHLINDYDQVITRRGEAVYSDLRFLTEEVEAFLARGGAVDESTPQQAACPSICNNAPQATTTLEAPCVLSEPARRSSVERPGVREISIKLYEARRAKGLLCERYKIGEARKILSEWPTERPKPKADTIAGHIVPVWSRSTNSPDKL